MNNVEDVYPLSPMQQGMLFHILCAPESAVYVEQISLRLDGDLDVKAFELAWQRVVERHSILRTGFIAEDMDEPLQVVRRQAKMAVEMHDWRGVASDEQRARLGAFQKADQASGFKLAQAPLMRCSLIRMGEGRWIFFWSYSHLLMDAWALPLVLKEVFTFYEAFARGHDLELERPRPYRDYIAWLRQQDLTRAEAYWRKHLAGFAAPTPLNIDKAHGGRSRETVAYGQERIELAAETTAALQSFGRRNQLTLNSMVQGAWALLLSRYSNEEEIVFGATVSGRPPSLAGIGSMVGLFINTLPVRARVDGGESLLSWLKRLQAEQAEMRQHEYTPLPQIQEWSDVPGGTPLFDSIVIFENTATGGSAQKQVAGVKVHDIVHYESRTDYPLTVVAEPGAELALTITYDVSRYDSQDVRRMQGHFRQLLGEFVAEPGRSLSSVRMLTEAERRQQLVEWNDTRAEYADCACLHELFERQAETNPDAVALIAEREELSYGELNARANQLAHHLRGMGVGPETRVGVMLERSVETLVGLLGILKAGGAYVPLDPQYPRDRLTFMLSDSAVQVLLTQQRLSGALPESAATVLCLDSQWPEVAARSTADPGAPLTADNLAYVIYTSGSTGLPKGAMLPHRGVVNCLRWMQQTYGLTRADRFLHKVSLNFDPSVWELFWPLMVGAGVVLAPAGAQHDSDLLIQTIRRRRCSVAYFVPSMLKLFLEADGIESLDSLRYVICGGESLPPEVMERFYARTRAELHHSYGPTETSIAATEWTCEAGGGRAVVPMGRPLANTQVYVLNRWLEPTPAGLAGEVYIGGVGLGRGYLGRPGLTGERFVPNPFAAGPGERLYKTGDLVRYLPDGNLEFLGRVDHQVKVNGYRIEPGEIEAALGGLPRVRAAVIAVRGDGDGGKQLVAYVEGEGELKTAELRRRLRERLPEHMVPSHFVVLDRLPLMRNGKVDRKALPDVSAPHRPADEYVAPHTEIERVVASVWQDVLQVEAVGVHDNFFDLGGNSLRMVRVHSQLRKALGQNFPMTEMFNHPTVKSLTGFLSGRETQDGSPRQDGESSERLSGGKERMKLLLKQGRRTVGKGGRPE
jgi:amino acid adenylation domain-containing protein